MTVQVLHGDCLSLLPTLPDNSIDAIVTDPPYCLDSIRKRFGSATAMPTSARQHKRTAGGFMGKTWDNDIAFRPDVWAQCLRVLKPGGHIAVFGGSRTHHRVWVAVEDAGFEIRDTLMWVYGSGFPKSTNISIQIDKQAQKHWLDVCKACDAVDSCVILAAWKEYLGVAKYAQISSVKSQTETGMNTLKSDSVRENVVISVNLEKFDAHAIIAELICCEALHMSVMGASSVQSPAEKPTMASSDLVTDVASQPENHSAHSAIREQGSRTIISIAPENVQATPSENTMGLTKAEEVLKTLLGSKPSSKREAIAALCAELTDALKLTILNRSKAFQNLDTTSQMDCASATTVTITEYTAANLISSTVDMLRHKAIDKHLGAEREVVGTNLNARESITGYKNDGRTTIHALSDDRITAPATPQAEQWQGWGTALKPSHEPILLARKPLECNTVAENVLVHGTGGINVDATRVPTDEAIHRTRNIGLFGNAEVSGIFDGHSAGRWPPNLLISIPEDEYNLRNDISVEQKQELYRWLFENA